MDTQVSSLSERTTLNLEETPESYAASIIRALSLEGINEMLLTCCWMSSDQKRYFHLYPTTFGFNVTHGTNAKKRPLGRGTVISPNRKITTVLNTLLPLEAAWVFGWLFKVAIPELVNN